MTMRGYWFIGNAETGRYQHVQLCQMVVEEQRRIVENYCGKKIAELDPHLWLEFFQDCFGSQDVDESIGAGEYKQLLYYIDKNKICVRSYGKDTLEARLIRLFRPKLRLKGAELERAIKFCEKGYQK